MSKTRKRLNYLGIFILLMALASFKTSMISMILLLIGGVTIFPNVREKILEIKPELHEKIPLLVSILFIIIGFASWSLIGKAKEEKAKSTVVPQKPTINKTPEQIQKEKIKAESDAVLAKAQLEYDLKSVAIPYSADGYPKLYSKWGAEWMDKANSMLMDAVLVADKNPKCDKPYQMGISESRSRVREELVFYVNCENLEQIIVSENDIQTGASIAATDILNQDNDYFYNNCRNSIKARLSNPSSFNQSILGTEIQKSKMGNVSVLMPFKHKNGFGNELKKTGKCIFDTRGNIETNIF